MKKAFTLIELLVVISIIGILAVVVIINLSGSKKKSAYASAKQGLADINGAIAISVTDLGTLPTTNNDHYPFKMLRMVANPSIVWYYSAYNIHDSLNNNLITSEPLTPEGLGNAVGGNTKHYNYSVYIKDGGSTYAVGLPTRGSGCERNSCSSTLDWCVLMNGSHIDQNFPSDTGSNYDVDATTSACAPE